MNFWQTGEYQTQVHRTHYPLLTILHYYYLETTIIGQKYLLLYTLKDIFLRQLLSLQTMA